MTSQARDEADTLGVIVWERSKLTYELEKKLKEVENYKNRHHKVI
jgi:hypothetical protein